MAEHDICNIEVVGSIPTGGSNVIDMCSTCPNCGKTLTKKQAKYCSNKCQQVYLRNQYIQRWKQGLETGLKGKFGISKYIREYLLNKYNYKCQKCGWGEINPYTNTYPLEIHHIDGNHLNNSEDNLQVLCPNCHSLTGTHKNHNRHSTRKHRNNIGI